MDWLNKLDKVLDLSARHEEEDDNEGGKDFEEDFTAGAVTSDRPVGVPRPVRLPGTLRRTPLRRTHHRLEKSNSDNSDSGGDDSSSESMQCCASEEQVRTNDECVRDVVLGSSRRTRQSNGEVVSLPESYPELSECNAVSKSNDRISDVGGRNASRKRNDEMEFKSSLVEVAKEDCIKEALNLDAAAEMPRDQKSSKSSDADPVEPESSIEISAAPKHNETLSLNLRCSPSKDESIPSEKPDATDGVHAVTRFASSSLTEQSTTPKFKSLERSKSNNVLQSFTKETVKPTIDNGGDDLSPITRKGRTLGGFKINPAVDTFETSDILCRSSQTSGVDTNDSIASGPRDIQVLDLQLNKSLNAPMEVVQSSPEMRQSLTEDHRIHGRTDDSVSTTTLSIQTLPTHVECRSAFDVIRYSASWMEEPQNELKRSPINCYGVVHVRVLRAQRLSCPVGSSVFAAISLLPWKGRVKTGQTRSFSGLRQRHGVCIEWDEDECSFVPLVHAYSSDESPIPIIRIDILFNPLGLFEVKLCTLETSCEPLFRFPRVSKRQWFLTTTSDVGDGNPHVPLIEIEAIFEPEERSSNIDDVLVESMIRQGTATCSVVDGSCKSSTNGSVLEDEVTPLRTSRVDLEGKDAEHIRATTSVSEASSIITPSLGSVRRVPHHLRLKTFWTPATCAVCGKRITAGLWRSRSFRCEVCSLDCCSDCRLHVDVQLPCGSVEAKLAVEKSIQNKFTLDGIVNAVAPVDSVYQNRMLAHDVIDESSTHHGPQVGIATFKFLQGFILQEPIDVENDPSALDLERLTLRQGDYFVRLMTTGSNKPVRTRTIQNTGRPRFVEDVLSIQVEHYGIEFRIDIVDGDTDKPVGTAYMTTQMLLQKQRDDSIAKDGIRSFMFHAASNGSVFSTRNMLEMRLPPNVENVVNSFAGSKLAQFDQGHQQVAGFLELTACVQENLEALYGNNPTPCPPRPPEDFDLGVFQIHLSRCNAIIDDVKELIESYKYVVSWKNPFLSGFALLFFLQCWYIYDPVYAGHTPIALLLLVMIYLAGIRMFGRFKSRFIQRELKAIRKTMQVPLPLKIHRSRGLLSVAVIQGKNIVSPDLGLPGSVSCRVHFDPARFMNESEKRSIAVVDHASSVTHELGGTAAQYKSDPKWGEIQESRLTQRLNALLIGSDPQQGEKILSRDGAQIDFPVLQQIEFGDGESIDLVSWSDSKAAIIFEVKFNDMLTLLPGSDYTLGEVVVPLSSLVRAGQMRGWFQVSRLYNAVEQVIPLDVPGEGPHILASLQWLECTTDADLESATEFASAVNEEMIRESLLSRDQKRNMMQSSIGAINTVRGLGNNIAALQNLIGMSLDILETIRNAMNFTDPFKSSVIFLVLTLIWIFLRIVPTSTLLLVVVLAPFALTLASRIKELRTTYRREHSTQGVDSARRSTKASPYGTWIINAFRGIPTDEDLRKAYFWESRRIATSEMKRYMQEKRKSRLQNLWKSSWSSQVELVTSIGLKDIMRKTVFAVFQGHRIIWWSTVQGFDEGAAPLGQILLAGHAGVATLSPLESRSLSDEERNRSVSIFGFGNGKQERVTIITTSELSRARLKDAVTSALAKKSD